MSNVKSYTDKQLLDKVLSIGGKVPPVGKYLIIGVQSEEDEFNVFDDKFYVFDGPKFIMVSSGTTNVGSTALADFVKYKLPGAAVWKTNQFIEDCYKPGLHKGRMKALRQNKPIYFYRDSDKDQKAEEQGALYHEIIWANMHGVDYDPFSKKISSRIGGWSFGCQVWNNMSDYRNMIKATWSRNKTVDYALLKEW
jgi:hypothetical protein